MVSYLLDKFNGHSHYSSGDIVFEICHMASVYHMFKELCDFMGRNPSSLVNTLLCLVAIGLMQAKI